MCSAYRVVPTTFSTTINNHPRILVIFDNGFFLAFSLENVCKKPSLITIPKSRVPAISKKWSDGLWRDTTLALDPYEAPERVFGPAGLRAPTRTASKV